MKKLLNSILIIFMIFFILSPISFAETNLKEQIKKEDGSLFEKIIAECIGGIAQTVLDFTTGKDSNVGFKDYDTLIFNNNEANDSLSPFTSELWSKTMQWYGIFASISGSLILIAVIILAYKIITAGVNTARKNEAKESLFRLLLGGVFIALAPMFIRFLLYMNNSMVHLLVTSSNGSLDGLLGNSMLTSIRTGNAITTALVISMFIYLFVKLNIKFIVRQFTIIIFTIFTPIACSLWIINKNVTAASIWAGQILMNIFMQFIYCFLFLIYLAFLPSGGGWAVSLIWAMMILPLADVLQNCLQNLTSRIAGINNEQISNRVLGTSAMLGFGLGAIKEQFNSPASKNSGDGSSSGFKGFVNRAKSIINPSMNLSSEKDYNGNTNPIRNVIPNESTNTTLDNNKAIRNSNLNNENSSSKSMVGKVAKGGYKAAKTYLEVGAKMAEGDFSSYQYKSKNKNLNKNTFANNNRFNETEFINQNNLNENNIAKNAGDINEPKR